MAESDVNQDVAQLQADFSQLRSDIVALTKSIADLTKRRAEDSVESLKAAGNQAADRVRAAAAEANAYKDARIAAAEAHVVEHPISSVLIAFTAGMILGKLVERR
jgi:ElaB/YqjD/DUF883 family membrane-anchored ribosome-binding protein